MSDEVNKDKEATKGDGKLVIPQDKVSVTEHSIRLGKKQLDYTVTAGTLILKSEDEKEGEKPRASIFYIAYQLKSDKPDKQRPITYSFNGGPFLRSAAPGHVIQTGQDG